MLTGFISQSQHHGVSVQPEQHRLRARSASRAARRRRFELNFTDKNFKFPQVWRTNLAVDQRLPLGLTGTVEFLYTKDMNGIGYANVNLPAAESTFTGPDNRPRWYQRPGCVPASGCRELRQGYRIYQNVSDAPVLTNEGVGHAYNISFSIERPLIKGFYGKVGYTYGESKNTGDPGSIAYGNWTGIHSAGDPNNPGVGYSSFSPGGRWFAALTYTGNLIMPGPTSIGLYLDGHTWGNGELRVLGRHERRRRQRERPDLHPEGHQPDELRTAEDGRRHRRYTRQQQQTAWTAFINQDKYLSSHRGQYAQRNAVFLPIVWKLDGSISQDIGQLTRGRPNSLQLRRGHPEPDQPPQQQLGPRATPSRPPSRWCTRAWIASPTTAADVHAADHRREADHRVVHQDGGDLRRVAHQPEHALQLLAHRSAVGCTKPPSARGAASFRGWRAATLAGGGVRAARAAR